MMGSQPHKATLGQRCTPNKMAVYRVCMPQLIIFLIKLNSHEQVMYLSQGREYHYWQGPTLVAKVTQKYQIRFKQG